MTKNEISYIIRGAIFNIYNKLGPGLLESVYVAAFMIELRREGLKVLKKVPLPVIMKTKNPMLVSDWTYWWKIMQL